ncbi:MAG: carboxypeptidase-like regulatory domain-containing protein [Flammeovirgaceae bacterium]
MSTKILSVIFSFEKIKKENMKKQLLVLIVAIVAFGCKKDDELPTGSIIGFVNLYSKSGSALDDFSGANVSIDNTKIVTTTDSDGKFELKNVPPGTYDISITKPGFGDYKQFSIPYAGPPAPGGIPAINTYTGTSPTIVIGEIPLFTLTDFSFDNLDGRLLIQGTASTANGVVIIYLSKGSKASNKDYDSFLLATVENGSFTYDITGVFPSGSNLKIIAYPTNSYSTIYIDRNTNKRIYTSLGKASSVINVTIL